MNDSRRYTLRSMRRLSLAILLLSALPVTLSHAQGHNHDHGHMQELKADTPTVSDQSLYNISSEWMTIDGQKVTLSSLQGQPRLVAMLYTSCTTACPMIVEDMKGLRSRLPEKLQGQLHITAFSFDPTRDTPERLREFAKKRSLNLQHWSILTPAVASSASELAAALGVKFKKVKDDYIHSNVIFLLNEKGEIVASKEGLGKTSKEFEAAIATLLQKKK